MNIVPCDRRHELVGGAAGRRRHRRLRRVRALIGHSGCGRSTLLNIIAGLLRADSGEILLDGQPVTGPGPDRAMVIQNYSLLPGMSVLANVREASRAARPQRPKELNHSIVERY